MTQPLALPELPPSHQLISRVCDVPWNASVFYEKDMYAYALAAQRLAIEEAARVCEARLDHHNKMKRYDAYCEADYCARDIRALMP